MKEDKSRINDMREPESEKISAEKPVEEKTETEKKGKKDSGYGMALGLCVGVL